jgi:hypothetical protein
MGGRKNPMAYETKTKASAGDVREFLAQVEDPAKRADSHALVELMQAVTGEEAMLWGTMVGFGRYHYKYGSGTEGDAFLVGFAPRRAEFSIYLMGLPEGMVERDALLSRLGKHRMGKGCLYVKRLADIDLGVLRDLAALSVQGPRAAYPDK